MVRSSAIVCCLIVFPLIASPALSQLRVEWMTLDGGGTTSSGGGLQVAGTLGQADAGAATSGTLTVEGGFWNTVHPFVPVELLSFDVVSAPGSSGRVPMAAVLDPPAEYRPKDAEALDEPVTDATDAGRPASYSMTKLCSSTGTGPTSNAPISQPEP
jgi:hypothetical protein